VEERGIARHAITQQPLVAGAVLQSEIGAVIEIHIHEAQLHDEPGPCAEAQRHAFLGEYGYEAVGFQISYRGVAEQDEGVLRTGSRSPSCVARAAFPCAVDGTPAQAPVVDLQFQRDKRFRIRIRRHIRLLRSNDALAPTVPGPYCPRNHIFQHIFGLSG